MAEPRGARRSGAWRRVGLIFAVSLAAHVAVFTLVGRDTVHPLVIPRDYVESAVPVEVVAPPRPRPPPPKPAPPKAVPKPAAAASPIAQTDPPPTLDAPPVAAAPTLGPPASGADAQSVGNGPADAASAAAAPPPIPTLDAPPAAGYPINPGYWSMVEHWPLISRTERYCVEPKAITRFMAAPCNHIYHCEYPVQIIGGGHFHFEGVISRHDERYNVHGGGDYSPTTLKVTVAGYGHWHLLPFAFSASLDGEFLGADCPADAKRVNQR